MFCTKCGAEAGEGAKFCRKCGNPISQKIHFADNSDVVIDVVSEAEFTEGESTSLATQKKEVPQLNYIEKYNGEEKVFPFLETELHVPKELDSFMYYRNSFKQNAIIQSGITKQEYGEQVFCLDQFFDLFPKIYFNNLKPLLENAFSIILSYGVYDITGEDFANQHMDDFCSVNDTYKTLQEAFNNTLIKNENAIHNKYANIPNIGFIGGIGTILAVEAANYAIKSSYESSLRNVNVNQAQRLELYNRIDFDMLMNQIYRDYWNVSFSLCYRLNTHGCGVWYPTTEGNARAEGLMKNLQAGLIPASEQVNVLLQVFNSRPIQGSLFGYLRRNYPGDADIEEICKYFGF
jgi:hypothetical protein